MAPERAPAPPAGPITESAPLGPAPQTGVFFRGLLSRPNCEVCPYRGSPMVPPEGTIGAKLAFGGEAPARNEVAQGRPLVGDSGRLYDVILQRCGIERGKVWTTNTILCEKRAAVVHEDGQFVQLTAEQAYKRAAAACRGRLVEELRAVGVRVYVPLGKEALSSIQGRVESIARRRGQVIEWRDPT